MPVATQSDLSTLDSKMFDSDSDNEPLSKRVTKPLSKPERKKRAPRTEAEKQELFRLDADYFFSLLIVKDEDPVPEPEHSYKARWMFWVKLCDELKDREYIYDPDLCTAMENDLRTRRYRLEMPWFVPGCEKYERTWYPDAWTHYEDTTPCFWNLTEDEKTKAVPADTSELEALKMTVASLKMEEKRAREIVEERMEMKKPSEMEVDRAKEEMEKWKREMERAKKVVLEKQKAVREWEKWVEEARGKLGGVTVMREQLESRLEELLMAKKVLESMKVVKKEA